MKKIRQWSIGILQHERFVTVVLAVFVFLVGAIFVVVKLRTFGYNALDLGIFHQVIAQTAAGHWFAATINPPSYFGDHVSPLLLAIVPFYWLAPKPETLLLLQVAMVVLGVWPLWILARRLQPAIRLTIVTAYLLSPLVQSFAAFEFEFLVFSVPLLFAVLVTYERRRFGWYLVWLILAAGIREDVGLVLIGLGALAWWDRRPWRWRISPLFLGILVFFGGMALTGSVNQEHYKFLVYYSWMGNTVGTALRYLALHPWMLFVKLFRLQNVFFVLTLVLLTAGIPLLRLRRMLPASLVLLALLLTNFGGDATTLRTHYPALVIPFLFWATIAGFDRLQSNPPRWLRAIFDDGARVAPAIFLVVVALYGVLTMSPFRPSAMIALFRGLSEPQNRVAASLLKKTPRDTGVAVSYAFLPYFGRDANLASLNYVFTGRRQFSAKPYLLPNATETILYDSNDYLFYTVQYPNTEEKFQQGDDRFRDLFTQRGFSVAEMVDSYLLLTRGGSAGLSSLYTVGTTPGRRMPENTPSPLSLLAIDGQPDETLHTELYQTGTTSVTTLPMALTWVSTARNDSPFHLRIDYVNKSGRAQQTRLYALGYGLFPTPEWPLNTPVTVRYRLVVPKLPAGTYTVRVRAEADGGYLTLDPKLTAILATTKRSFGSESVSLGTLIQQ